MRQKGGQRKTLFYLEQLLIKYEATRECSAIQPNAEGLDFFFGSESGARDGLGLGLNLLLIISFVLLCT